MTRDDVRLLWLVCIIPIFMMVGGFLGFLALRWVIREWGDAVAAAGLLISGAALLGYCLSAIRVIARDGRP